MDEFFKNMFGGGASFSFDFEDAFDDFTEILKGESKAFTKMMREMERTANKKRPKGRASRAGTKTQKKPRGGDMDEMMMAMMMGGSEEDLMMSMMMSELMDGGKKKKGKKSAKGKQPMMDPLAMMMGLAGDSSDEEDLFAGDEYDSDEVEMIGKQMGLSKKEIGMLKSDLKKKYEKANPKPE
jgi:hypothetical protein